MTFGSNLSCISAYRTIRGSKNKNLFSVTLCLRVILYQDLFVQSNNNVMRSFVRQIWRQTIFQTFIDYRNDFHTQYGDFRILSELRVMLQNRATRACHK